MTKLTNNPLRMIQLRQGDYEALIRAANAKVDLQFGKHELEILLEATIRQPLTGEDCELKAIREKIYRMLMEAR